MNHSQYITALVALTAPFSFGQSGSNVDNGGLGFRLSETRTLSECNDVSALPGVSTTTIEDSSL